MSAPGPRPDWLFPLPKETPPARDALATCIEAFRYHDAPDALCPQCFPDEALSAPIFAAARLAQRGTCPRPEQFAQIYFEHPRCVGGEETIKLFLPYGIQTMLTGTVPDGFGHLNYSEVLETALQAGFWFWRPDLIAPLRILAARLFEDWFTSGHYGLDGWPHRAERPGDLTGPGDDILQFCTMCLIDPAELLQTLSDLHTPWADDTFSGAGSISIRAPFYVSMDTGQDEQPYTSASHDIARSLHAREARAFCHLITPDWLSNAFFRRDRDHPRLAKALSEFENHYDVKMIEIRKTAQAPIMSDWPDLPTV